MPFFFGAGEAGAIDFVVVRILFSEGVQFLQGGGEFGAVVGIDFVFPGFLGGED